MTEAERQALIEDISNAVITRLNQNSVDWSSNTITFGDRYDIQVNERQNIKIPAIDKRNGITYGNLDLNTLLTAYGLTQAMKSVESVEDAAETAKNELNSILENLEDYLPIAGGEMAGPIDMNGNNISDVSKVQSIVSDGASAETIFAPYYSYSTLGVSAGDYQSFFMAWLKKMATLYPNIKASIIGQATPAYRSFIVCYMQSTTLTADGYPKYASGMFFSYKENEAYHFLFDNGTFKMNKVVTGDVYNKSEVDNLIANAGGGGSSEVSSKLIAGSENATGGGGYDTNSDADINAFIETGIVKWAKYRNISGLPNGDGMVQSIGWRSPVDGAGWGRQIAYDDESHNIYSRYLGNGSWSAWKKVLVDGDINLSGYVPTSRTVNGKALSGNISLSASDVGASATGHSHSEYKVVTNYAHGTTGTKTLSAIAVNQMGFFSYRFDGSGGSVKLPSGGTYLAMTFYNQGDESNHVTFSKSSYVSLSGGAIIASINPDNDLNSSYAYCYGIYIRKS